MRMRIEARNAAVGVAGGVIVEPTGRFDAVVRIPDGDLRPGLINAHDHLHRNHYGRLGVPPYANAYDWGRDIHARFREAIERGRAFPRRAALLVGAWKNLFAGVTTVVHHDAWEPAFDDKFPVRVARMPSAHSLGFEKDQSAWRFGAGPFCVHLAEGVDRAAADEVRELDWRGLVTQDLLAVHAIGVDADGIGRLRAADAAIVWCPTSNLFLFGRTAPAALLESGIDVLLGSDSLLSGEGTLLDELRCARALELVTDDCLVEAVGRVAARRLGLSEPSLEIGAPADLVVLRRPLLDATTADVALVVVAGVPRVAEPGLAGAFGAAYSSGRLLAAYDVVRWILDDTSTWTAYQPPRPTVHDARPNSARTARL
jgi:Amidohydrolase family